MFVSDGVFWTIGYLGSIFSVRDLKGLYYLQQLLRHPNHEFHSLDLLTSQANSGETRSEDVGLYSAAQVDSVRVRPEGDAGPILDTRAKTEYKRRLNELKEERDECLERGDHRGVDRIQSEIDAITHELTHAIGLRGRDRKLGSAAERARLNVVRAIKAALEKIADGDAELAQILGRDIRTGTFCSYIPDEKHLITWQFDRGDAPAKMGFPAPPLATPQPQALKIKWVLDSAPFVGRAAECSVLLRNLEMARAGMGRIVIIRGEAGIGKTRLSREFCELASADGFLAIAGGCYDANDSVPFVPFVEILESASAQASSPEAFRAALGPNAAELVQIMPQLRTIVPDLGAPQQVSTQQSRRLLFNSVVELVSRVSAQVPLLLLIEDLQWADEGSLALLVHLAHAIANLPVMILANYRDKEADAKEHLAQGLYRLSREENREEINLAGLLERDVALMLKGLSDKDPPSSLVSVIHSTTDGNPLFVRELYEHLAEAGKLFGIDQRFLRTVAIDERDVPQGIRILLAHRLSRFEPDTRTALACAATIGRSFTFELLEASSSIDSEVLLNQLEQAEDLGLLNSVLENGEARFYFSHELVRQAILADVSAARQQRLHIAVGNALEKIYSTTLQDHAVELAYHFSAAGSLAEKQKTIDYLVMAARREMAQSAYANASRHLSLALTLFSALPEQQRTPEQELWLQLLRGNASSAAKGWAAREAGKAYERAQALCAQMGDTPQLFPVIAGLCAFHFVRGEYSAALSLAQRSAQMADRLDDDTAKIGAHWLQGCSLFFLGDFVGAREHLEKGVLLHRRHEGGPERFTFGQDGATACLAYAGFSAWCLGRRGGTDEEREATQLAARLAHPFTTAWELTQRAVFHAIRDEWSELSKVAEQGKEISEKHGFDFFAVSFDFFEAVALASNRPTEGIDRVRRTISEYRSMGAEMLVPWNHTMLAQALIRTGRIEEAHAALDEAFAVMSRTEERHYDAESHRVRGEAYLAQANKEPDLQIRESCAVRGEQYLKEARRIAEKQGAVAYEIRAALSLGKLWMADGRNREAMQMLRQTCDRASQGWTSPDFEDAQRLLAGNT